MLADFGIARNVDDISGLTATNMTVGTVAYAAPEQLMGEELDGRADQYALAATAYHLLTGSQLFPHSNPAVVISRHLNAAPPVLADTRPELAALDPVLAVALAKSPDDRFPRCTDFARALAGESTNTRRAWASPTAPTRPAPTSRPAVRSVTEPTKRSVNSPTNAWLIPAVVAAVLILIAGGVLVWRPWSSHDGPTRSHASPTSSVSAVHSTTTVPTSAPAPPPSRSEAPAPVTTTVPTSTTTLTGGATLGLACTDYDKIVYDPTTGQEIACMERFSPYGWLWKAAPSTDGVHIRGASCEGQRAWSPSRTPDGYLIECIPDDIRSTSPIAGPGSVWGPPANV